MLHGRPRGLLTEKGACGARAAGTLPSWARAADVLVLLIRGSRSRADEGDALAAPPAFGARRARVAPVARLPERPHDLVHLGDRRDACIPADAALAEVAAAI